jgi:hypothetical protein
VPAFNATVTVRLAVAVQLTAHARDEDAVRDEAQRRIDAGDFAVVGHDLRKVGEAEVTDEVDNTAEIDTIDEE